MASSSSTAGNSSKVVLASRIAYSRKRSRAGTPKNRQRCPHCEQDLTIKTFKRHQKLFKREDGNWMKEIDEEDENHLSSDNGSYCYLATLIQLWVIESSLLPCIQRERERERED